MKSPVIFFISNGFKFLSGIGKSVSRAVLVFILFVLTNFLCSHANSGQFNQRADLHFRQITINDGLSQNLISAIHQDQTGFIWIGTKDGLNRYDGYKFTIFKHDPFDPHSISENHIESIFLDRRGRLWIGTFSKGLNLYDTSTGHFIRFSHDPNNPNSISSDNILSITDDPQGNLWIGTSQGGLNKISFKNEEALPSQENIEVARFGNKPSHSGLSSRTGIPGLFLDSQGVLWVGSSNSIFRLDTKIKDPILQEIPVRLIDERTNKFLRELHNKEGRIIFFQDAAKAFWMVSRLGLFQYDKSIDAFRQVLTEYSINEEEGTTYNPLAAVCFQRDGSQELWLSTEKALFIYYPDTGSHQALTAGDPNMYGLPSGQIISLFKDTAGTLWLGSNGYGMALYDPFKIKFSYPNETGVTNEGDFLSSRHLSIRSLFQTPDGTLWIGANEGFYKVNRADSDIRQVNLSSRINPQMVVYSIDQGRDGRLWLASSAGLVHFNPDNESFTVYPAWHQEASGGNEPSIDNNDPRVLKVLVDNENIWILTPYSLALFDKQSREFDHLRFNNDPLNPHREHTFPNLLLHENVGFWVGSHHGLHHIFFQTKEIKSYSNNPLDPQSLPFNNVRAIIRDPLDPDSTLWLATGGGGIAKFDLKTETFTGFSEEQGLANKMVYGMLADDNANFWLSTNKGLSKFEVKSQSFINYTVSDGLQSNEFNSGAFYKNSSGELFFGGIHGYNSFFPEKIRNKDFMAQVVMTGFNLLKSADETDSDRFHVTYGESMELVLKHFENSFSIEFASLDYFSPDENRFAYNMGFLSENWIEMGTNHVVTLTDLKPGTYYFRVRGTNNDGVWSHREALLKITILTPWWARNWMITVYFFLGILIVAGLRQYEMSRFKLRNRVRLVELETEKLKELDHLKSQFFANISHEFRTPLTLILGPVEQMLKENDDPKKHKTLSVMHSNATKLLTLVNQLLELSKLESGNYKIKVSTGDLIGFLKGLFMSFTSLAEQKNIKLHFEHDPKMDRYPIQEQFYFDRDILEKIFSNLISNALKFTPENGEVSLKVCLKIQDGKGKWIEISVNDSGIGISHEKLPFIFDRFYQADASSKRDYEGSGIGLAFVKELIRVHKGKIIVKSTPDHGTKFILRFPFGQEHFNENQITDKRVQPAQLQDTSISSEPQQIIPEELHPKAEQNKNQPLVLVVEDHPDVSHYISQSLKPNFRVEEAPNATTGLDVALEMIPDLVICDIMMPGMDGLKFCEILKNDIRTSHIPLILLTALAEEDARIDGLETGADDYLTKPFNPRELLARVNNLIENRQMLRQKFSSNAIIKPGEISVTPRDKVFMENLIKVVEDNLDNENYSIEDLSRDVGMSQSQLHRKLKALVNQTTNHFVRSIKMHRAKELLEKDAGTIAEIAYMVGYEDPGYFSKSFKAFFGQLPSEIKKKAE